MLSWDQQVMMPPGGVEHRGEQLAQLAHIIHDLAADPEVGQWLNQCASDTDLMSNGTAAVNVREIRREHDRATKLPRKLVEELARTTTIARAHWQQARREDDSGRFRPWLERIVELTRQKAHCLGWDDGGDPWDALADDYETGLTAASVHRLFDPLRQRLITLLDTLRGRPNPPPDAAAEWRVPVSVQARFVRHVAERMGFDFSRGRLDTSAHPFCSGPHPGDVRMTSRFDQAKILDGLGSTMHEAGHGIYNQGLPLEHAGTPLGSPVGLSIHESQSRLWENQVGRSASFCDWCAPILKRFAGGAVAGLSPRAMHASANLVRPDLIRVEADEATYNLHIMMRFDLERALIRDDLAVADLPNAWSEKVRSYLGVPVPDDARGCMQDIHWSQGAIGYFPTYTMGTLYAAQFFEKATRDMPGLVDDLRDGRFEPLKAWLHHNVHRHGKRFESDALCQRVTGAPLSIEPFIRHLEGKLGPFYGV